MNEQIKTTTVDQLPEATSLDGLYVFGYASKNAVGKRSVKAPITLLKGNKGDTGAAGKDGEVTAAQLKAALISNENLATEATNGLMSKEQVKQLNEIIDGMTGYSNKYNTHVTVGYQNTELMPVSVMLTEFAKGNFSYIVKNAAYLRHGNTYTGLFDIQHHLAQQNDVISAYMNDIERLYATTNNLASFMTIRTSSDSKTSILVLNNTKLKNIDVRDFASLTEVISSGTTALDTLSLLYNIRLKSISMTNNAALRYLTLAGKCELESIDLNNSPKLTSLSINSETPSLKSVDISKTAITKATLLGIEMKWTSRIGKDTGLLKLDKTLYDALSSDERKLFTDKNITFDIVG